MVTVQIESVYFIFLSNNYVAETLFMYYIIFVRMKFVDRIEEQKRLKGALNANVPSFIVVYGRSRLGKSSLIKQVLLFTF